MYEDGKVVGIKGDTARIEVDLKSACSACPASKICTLGIEGKRYIDAIKEEGIRIGDRVRVEIKGGKIVKGTFLLFFVPALMFLIGLGVGELIKKGQLFSLLMGVGFVGVSFFIIHQLDKHWAKKEKFKPRIIQVIK